MRRGKTGWPCSRSPLIPLSTHTYTHTHAAPHRPQNDLHELWALLNYIMPDVFDSSDTFDEWFSMDGKGGGQQTDNVIRKLHQVRTRARSSGFPTISNSDMCPHSISLFSLHPSS